MTEYGLEEKELEEFNASECGRNAIVANWLSVLSNYCPFCGCLMDRNDFDTYIKSESEVEECLQ